MNIQAALVRSILEKYRSYEWSTQGFGMIRTKIANVGRIHVWDSEVRVHHVSDIHAHPWPLHSTIISGELINQLFDVHEKENALTQEQGLPYTWSKIATGEGGGLIGDPIDVMLTVKSLHAYTAGMWYKQQPEETHRTIPQDGTVTLLERPQGDPLQETAVYWPRGTRWVSAEPYPAPEWQVERIIQHALARWAAK